MKKNIVLLIGLLAIWCGSSYGSAKDLTRIESTLQHPLLSAAAHNDSAQVKTAAAADAKALHAVTPISTLAAQSTFEVFRQQLYAAQPIKETFLPSYNGKPAIELLFEAYGQGIGEPFQIKALRFPAPERSHEKYEVHGLNVSDDQNWQKKYAEKFYNDMVQYRTACNVAAQKEKADALKAAQGRTVRPLREITQDGEDWDAEDSQHESEGDCGCCWAKYCCPAFYKKWLDFNLL